MEGLIEGRIVHYVISSVGVGVHRPAIIVQIWSQDTGMSNLSVFLDGQNDEYLVPWLAACYSPRAGQPYNIMFLASSIPYDPNKSAGTWHWIEGSKPGFRYQEKVGHMIEQGKAPERSLTDDDINEDS